MSTQLGDDETYPELQRQHYKDPSSMSPKSFFSSSSLTLGPNEKHRGPFELTRKLFCLKKWDEVRLQNRA